MSIISRRGLLALAVPAVAAVMCVGTSLPARAALLEIEVAPPAPRVVVVPAPRAGFVWAPGFWRWEGHRHVWEDGHWERERPGHHWIAARWVPVGAHYRFEEGHWD